MAERTESTTNGPDVKPRQGRKPYAAPMLRRLGSVRDLTLGSSVGCLTEASPKFPKKRG
jgi:hypothetical protein